MPNVTEMETLHAPWRIEYVTAPKASPGDTSVFANIAQSNDDEANYVIARRREGFAVLNTYPYNGGHTLIIPYRQVTDLDDLTGDENLGLLNLIQEVKRAMTASMNPDGFNVGLNLGPVAGAGIAEHLHWHIVPRWKGDTNFMPVTGQTNVLPEALAETAAKLRTELCNELK